MASHTNNSNNNNNEPIADVVVGDITIIDDDDDEEQRVDYHNDHDSESSTEEFNFAAALALRKNLTETFDQQVNTTSSVSQKIARFEKKTTVSQKPPRQQEQQHHPRPPRAAVAASFDHQHKCSKTTSISSSNTRCVSVYLRIRPPKQNNDSNNNSTSLSSANNTVEILEPTPSSSSSIATTIRTYPPIESNAAKVVRHEGGVVASREAASSETTTTATATVKGIKEFAFQQVFGPDSSQQDLYSTVAAPLVDGLFPDHDSSVASSSSSSSLVGHSALLFAYGITNAGKTHTIMGDVKGASKKNKTAPVVAGVQAKWGIVPRALHDIFANMSSQKQVKYDLHLSYLEIYNEGIYDLLPKEKGGGTSSSSFRNNNNNSVAGQPLRLREGRNGHTFVRGLSKHRVKSVTHGLELAEKAKIKRHTSSNNLNKDSSRSHCICQLELVARTNTHPAVLVNNDDDDDSVVTNTSNSGYTTDEEAVRILQRKDKAVTLWIVDLAGSERTKRTATSGVRQKEAALINASLMKLMRCLSVMRENQGHHSMTSSTAAAVVPFRESKLTHLFMNHLTGKSASRTCMIVNINPTNADFDETQHVLSYASAAKSVQISQDDYHRKRRAITGSNDSSSEATHGYDGRPLKKHASNNNNSSSRPTKIARLVKKFSPKKLSPKKFLRKATATRKQHIPGNGNKKRKAETVSVTRALGTTAAVTTTGGSSSSHMAADNGRKHKMPRLGEAKKPEAKGKASSKMPANYETEMKILKTSLMIAQAEKEVLKSEKGELQEELSHLEEQVRMEVAEETEEQMKAMREQYNSTIGRLKCQLQTNPTPANKSAKKAQQDKAEQVIEELMDKVEECEEEMVRMRNEHEEEVTKLQTEHQEALETKDVEIQSLRATHDKELEVQNEKVKQLENEIAICRAEIETLRKSKEELMETYENIIREEKTEVDQDETTTQREDEKVGNQVGKRSTTPRVRRHARHSEVACDNMENNMPNNSHATKSSSKKKQKKNGRRVLRSRRAGHRTPFSSISSNQVVDTHENDDDSSQDPASSDSSSQSYGISSIDEDEESLEDAKLLYPKKPTIRDDDGTYQRPRGRAPNGREWDATFGAWRLSVA